MVEVDEKIRALRLIFGHKQELIRFLSHDFGLRVSTTVPYNEILRKIVDNGIEQRFCQAVFHTDSFDEGVSVLKLRLGLGVLSWGELRDLADYLSDNEKKWKFQKSRNVDIIDAILHNCSKEKVDEAIYRLILDEKMEPVQQYQEWVIGPLGISQSIGKRGSLGSDSIIAFLSRHIDASLSEEILKARFMPQVQLDLSLLKHKIIQLVLTHGKDEEILELFNDLLANKRLRIDGREDYWDFFATPAGIFERTYDEPIGKLADILISSVSEEDLRRELKLGAGKLRVQIIGECLRKNPDAIVSKFFAMPDLRKVARKIGLVATDSILDNQELIEIMLLRLGFEVPRPPRGAISLLKTLESSLRTMETDDLQSTTGMVTTAYVQLERLLKDMIFFYTSVFWEDEIEYIEGTEVETISDYLRSRFKIPKPVNRLTLGELVELLLRIENSDMDRSIRSLINEKLGRASILSQMQKSRLRSLSARRKNIAHHVSTAATKEDCKYILTEMKELLTDLEETQAYPRLILIMSEATNEYGISSMKAVDEHGFPWTIKSEKYELGPAQQCLLLSETVGIAIDPVIVKRFWEFS